MKILWSFLSVVLFPASLAFGQAEPPNLMPPSAILLQVVRSPVFGAELSRHQIVDVTGLSIVREQGFGSTAIYRVTATAAIRTSTDAEAVLTPVTAYARWVPRNRFGRFDLHVWAGDAPVVDGAVTPEELSPPTVEPGPFSDPAGDRAPLPPVAPAPETLPPSVSRPRTVPLPY